MPNDPESPFVTSGVRLGTAAVTTRGFKEPDMVEVAKIISAAVMIDPLDELSINNLKNRSLALCKRYKLY